MHGSTVGLHSKLLSPDNGTQPCLHGFESESFLLGKHSDRGWIKRLRSTVPAVRKTRPGSVGKSGRGAAARCRNVKEEELLAQTGKKIIVTKDGFVTDE